MKTRLLAGCVAVLAGTTLAHADIITEWNQALLDSVAAENTAPPRASRAMAMVHVAQFQAVNNISRQYNAYDHFEDAPAGASTQAAAALAAHRVMTNLYPGRAATFNALLTTQLNAIPDSQSKLDGIEVGEHAGDDILFDRLNDNSNASITYSGGTTPGQWRPTGPGFQNAALPHWRYVTPWVVNSAQQFMAGPPPQINSAEYAAAFNEVKELGALNSATRTQQQTDTAFLWRAGNNTVTPPGQWNQVAQQLSSSHSLTIEESSRLFALLGMSVADAGITAWETKNTYNFWRPETGIQLADQDLNAATVADPLWQPLFVTPNHQTYTSGHSTFSASAAALLAAFFGGDNETFTVTGDGVTRQYTSLAQAASDAGMSRIYGGIHWQFDNTAGLASGSQIGSWVFENALTPIPTPGALALAATGFMFCARRRRA
jgi:hypothetical protein